MKEMCFKLVGYPDWWEDGHKKTTGWGKPAPAAGNLATTIDNRSGSRGGTSLATHDIHGSRPTRIEM